MKRKWHIRTHVLVTLVGLTCAVLLVVGLAFNLSIRGYIRSRVSAQLADVLEAVSEDRRDSKRERKKEKRFDGRPDRITGTRGSAILIGEDGSSALYGDDDTTEELAEYYRNHVLTEDVQNQLIVLDSGTYVVSALQDPAEDDQILLVYVDVTAISALTRQINLVLLVVILAAILLSVILSRRFARLFSEPVQSLSDFASEIGGGNLTMREFCFRDVEFDSLAASMNDMAAELREAKQKQETFFQNVSHELRTPLTSIRGNAEGIVYDIMEPHAAGKVILSETDKLGGMVEDILYLSRMGKSKPEGTAAPLDLREVLSLCTSEQRAEAERKGVVFRFNFDEAPVLLQIREQDAQRLFGNLISNAIRYADKEVALTCRTKKDCVFVSVADDGAGVAEGDLPHIFERFYKGEGGKHGIGLAIAQAVVESYHGAISVHNDGGAVFTVRFVSVP